MKMKQLFTGLLLVVAVAFTACKAKPKDMLAQKWKIADLGTVTPIPETAKAEMLKDAKIEFNQDGSYSQSSANMSQTGKYTLSDDGKTLTLLPSSGEKADVTITELSKSKMVLSAKNTTITCVPQ